MKEAELRARQQTFVNIMSKRTPLIKLVNSKKMSRTCRSIKANRSRRESKSSKKSITYWRPKFMVKGNMDCKLTLLTHF